MLVTAAAGGTGQFAVQLAKLAGCHVIATCGGPGKAEMLRQLGVDRVIDYTKEKLKVIYLPLTSCWLCYQLHALRASSCRTLISPPP